MIKRILLHLAALVSLTVSATADNDFSLGNATFSIPEGWTKIAETDGRLTFTAPDGKQQATVSLMRFGAAPSFEDFERICSHRYDAEKNGLTQLTLVPEHPDPHDDNGTFTMSFSGKEEANDRSFLGLMSFKNKQLITIYVEGIGVNSATNHESFREFVESLKQ
jgi:hypothetical protein